MLKNKNILVIGGCGFIGSHIGEQLCTENSVNVIDNLSSGRIENIRRFNIGRFFEWDIRYPSEEFHNIFDDVDVVFHEAANIFINKSIEKPVYDAETNIIGTLNVLEACRKKDIKRLVFAASSAAYGDPISLPIKETHPLKPDSPYAVSKIAGEYYCKIYNELYGLETVCLRYFNVYGPRQDSNNPYSGVIAIFASNVINNSPLIIYGDGEQTRDFIHVFDVVRANIIAAESKKAIGKILNIGTGQSTSINELAALIKTERTIIKYAPPRPGDIKENVADTTYAKSILGFIAEIDLKAGLRSYINWLKENKNQKI
jgi:UDP-glucose 4-epimerase